MKRIIDIPDRTYDFIMGLKQHTFGSKYAHKDVQADVVKAVKESKPYDDSGDCIRRETLKKTIHNSNLSGNREWLLMELDDIIDNAPTVEPICPYLSDNEVKQPCLNSPCERPQGEWARHDEWRGGEYIGGFYHVNCPCIELETALYSKWRTNFCPNCGLPMRKGGAE